MNNLKLGKTTLEFDVELEYEWIDTDTSYVRFQNNVRFYFSFRFNLFSTESDYCTVQLR